MALPQSMPDQYNFRSGLVLYPQQQTQIEQNLNLLVQQVPATFALLADVTGQVVYAQGRQNQENLVALGSLVAGDLAASHEIARLTGQYQEHQMILREGETTHTFIGEAGHHLALLVQVATDVPLGWARIIIRRSAAAIAQIADTPPPNSQTSEPDQALLNEDLPDLFNDALDDLWLE